CIYRVAVPGGVWASPQEWPHPRRGPARSGRPGLSVFGFPTVLVLAVGAALAPRRIGALGARLTTSRVSIVETALGLVDVGLHVEPGGLLHLIADLVEVDAAVVEERLRIEPRPIRRRRRVVGHDPVDDLSRSCGRRATTGRTGRTTASRASASRATGRAGRPVPVRSVGSARSRRACPSGSGRSGPTGALRLGHEVGEVDARRAAHYLEDLREIVR